MENFLIRSASNPSLSHKRLRETNTSPDQGKHPKRFIANPKAVGKDNRTPTNNRFAGLAVDEAASEPYQNATKKKGANNIPPIVIELQGEWVLEKIRNTIKSCLIKEDFHMQYRGRKTVRVQCYTVKSHQQVRDCLVKEGVAFHTFTRRDEKLPKAVIKGLPKCVQPDIPEELASLGFTGATVSELKTLHVSECPPVLVQLPSGTNMTKFKQIRYLSSCVIDIQKYKPSKKPGTQCFRCQGFGHASRNCNKPARCVKCAMPHPTWECPKKDRTEPARCCNCQEEHPANYTQCTERLKYLARIETKRETVRKEIISDSTRSRLDGQKTWAQITGNSRKKVLKPQVAAEVNPETNLPINLPAGFQQTRISTENRASNVEDTNKKSLLDFETTEMLILTTIQSIKQDFKKCKTFMEKVILILTHLGHYV